MNLICNNVVSSCFENANLFQQDWYIREQFEHNSNFTFAYAEFLVRNTTWAWETIPSWTEPWRNLQNTHKHTYQTSHYMSRIMTWLRATFVPICCHNVLLDSRSPPSNTLPFKINSKALSRCSSMFIIICMFYCTINVYSLTT